MLSQCLNPACSATFRYMHEGRVFTVERTAPSASISQPLLRSVERYWLCSGCALLLKVVVENGTVTTRRIRPELPAARKTGRSKMPATA